jgi:hypothetical protein
MILLDAAPLMESNAFVPDAAGPGGAPFTAGALEAAIGRSAAGGAGAAEAARGEMLFDLFVDSRAGYRAEGAERTGDDILAATGWRGPMFGEGGHEAHSGPDGHGGKDLVLRAAFDDVDGDGEEDEPITVTGKRPKNVGTGEDTGGAGGGGDYPGGPGGGGGGDGLDKPSYKDCEKDNKALEIATDIKSMAQGRIEYGALLYKDANGQVHSGPISFGEPGTVTTSVPNLVGISNIIGWVHTHPPRAPTGTVDDQAYRIADMYPSPDDWYQLNVLALQITSAGGDPTTLSMYIIDQDGVMREYNIADQATYNLSENQLLQKPGEAALPPPPGAILVPRYCGSGG